MDSVIVPIKTLLVAASQVKHLKFLFPTKVVHPAIVLTQAAPVASGVLLLPHFKQILLALFLPIASQLVSVPTATHVVPKSVSAVQSERAFPATHLLHL